MNRLRVEAIERRIGAIAIGIAFLSCAPVFAGTIFDTGNLVVSVEGCGIEMGAGVGCASVGGTGTGTLNSTLGGYGDNQAAPLTLFQFTTGGTYVNSLVLPQTSVSGGNFAVSGEYGSSSEAQLQLSGNGQYLTIMGYGIGASAFNTNPNAYSATPNAALAQSGSLTLANQTPGSTYTPIARVVPLIDGNGNVNSTTGLYNVFSTNNPRSAYTLDGTTVYVSGQGSGSDATGGVFYSQIGGVNNNPTAITGLDTSSGTVAEDTRVVQIYNNQLYVSVDSKAGSGGARSFVGTLGSPPATTLYNGNSGPTQLTGFGTSKTGQETVTALTGNNLDASAAGAGSLQINLSPEDYFFANATTLYVADSGDGKQTSGSSTLGDGGLQKWTYNGTTWVLDYTISAGLNLVANTTKVGGVATGTTGLEGLTGELIDDGTEVELFATNYTLNDLDQTYLYGIDDVLADTTLPTGALAEAFTTLAAAPADSNFKGVSFAPTSEAPSTPEPASFALFGLGMTALLIARRRKAA